MSVVRDARLGLVVDARRMDLGQAQVDAAELQMALDAIQCLGGNGYVEDGDDAQD